MPDKQNKILVGEITHQRGFCFILGYDIISRVDKKLILNVQQKIDLIRQDVSCLIISGQTGKDIRMKKQRCLKNFCIAMHICYINMRRMEGFRLPKLFMVSGYTVSNENGEPIHVHVSKGKPTPNATKIQLTKSGGCILASNGSKISDKELNGLRVFISAQFFLICAKWKQAFVIDEIKVYCQERQTDDAEKEFYGRNLKFLFSIGRYLMYNRK